MQERRRVSKLAWLKALYKEVGPISLTFYFSTNFLLSAMESSTALTLFPKKPARAQGATGRPLKLYSNYFQIVFDQKDIQGVNKYTVKFEPEIPDNSKALRKDVLRSVRDKIKEKLEFFIDWGTCVYSLRKCADLPVYEGEHDGTKYKIALEWV